ncbi:MAG: bifunctional nuclease family protein, partial [Bacteroidales bacterium]
EEGVFFAQLLCDNGVEKITLDARTSDAIALALRFKCPIYTTEEIIAKAGIVLDFDKESGEVEEAKPKDKEPETFQKPKSADKTDYSSLSMEELKKLLNDAISNENYEKASALKSEIDRRNKK